MSHYLFATSLFASPSSLLDKELELGRGLVGARSPILTRHASCLDGHQRETQATRRERKQNISRASPKLPG